jgi:hypothetical protein
VEVVVQLAPSVPTDNSRPGASQPVVPQPASDATADAGQLGLSGQDSTSSGGPICHLMIHLPAAKLTPAPTLFADDNSNSSPADATVDNSSLAATGVMPADGSNLAGSFADVGPDGTLQDAMSLQDLNSIINPGQPPTPDASASPQGSAWPNSLPAPSSSWMGASRLSQ